MLPLKANLIFQAFEMQMLKERMGQEKNENKQTKKNRRTICLTLCSPDLRTRIQTSPACAPCSVFIPAPSMAADSVIKVLFLTICHVCTAFLLPSGTQVVMALLDNFEIPHMLAMVFSSPSLFIKPFAGS